MNLQNEIDSFIQEKLHLQNMIKKIKEDTIEQSVLIELREINNKLTENLKNKEHE